MLTLHRAGDGWLHRVPAGPKMAVLSLTAVGIGVLPTRGWAVAVAVAVPVVAYAGAGFGVGAGLRELGRQLLALRWVGAVMLVGQLVFLGPEPAAANTTRVVAALVLAGLLPLTTRVSALLDALERGLRPLGRWGVDVSRAALLVMVTITTIPVLARLAGEVREAQRARGARPSLRIFVVPFLVLALRHADQLGDALAARGVR